MMRRIFENAWFITGTQEFPGKLADTAPGRKGQGFLSFVRLIGTCTLRNTVTLLLVLCTPH